MYPVVQLLLGSVRLVPSPRYFPLRLRLVRALNELSAATAVYVPVSGILLEMLRWSDLTKAPKGGAGPRTPNTDLQLRVGKTILRTPAFQEETILQARHPNFAALPIDGPFEREFAEASRLLYVIRAVV